MAKKKRTGLWITLLLLALLIIIAVAVIGYSSFKGNVVNVTTEEVSRRTITQTVSAIGKIQPETEVKISTEASGEIITLGINEGDFVRRNQLLVRIKPDLVESQLEQMRASVRSANVSIDVAKIEEDRAQKDLKRSSELYVKEYVSKQEFEQAKAAYERAVGQVQQALTEKTRAEASLKQMQVSASRTSIFSPIDGTVTSLMVESGEKVVGTAQMQGTEMMRVSDLSLMNAIVDVDENDVVKINIGDTARVKIDAFPDSVFIGLVYQISHSAKQKGLGSQDEVTNFEVRVRLIDIEERLRPGMSCSVDIETETHANILTIPLGAVTIKKEPADDSDDDGVKVKKMDRSISTKKQSNQIVFVYENGVAKEQGIETGLSDKGYIEVTSGLTENQTVISGSFQTVTKVLEDKMKVKKQATTEKNQK